MKFSFNGETILFDEGIKDLTGTKTDGNLFLEQYKDYLKDKGWLDWSNPEYAVRGEKKSYRNIFPLDLSTFDVRGNNELSVHLTFDENNSPEGLQAFLIRVVEGDLRRETSGTLKRWTVVPSATQLTEK